MNLIDKQPRQLQESSPYIDGLRSASQKPSSHTWGAIRTFPTEDLKAAVADAWLILEVWLIDPCPSFFSNEGFKCVPEKLPIKRTALTELDQVAPPDAIIASNSSSYGITEVIEGLKLKNLDRAMSAHCCESNSFQSGHIALI